MLALSGIGYIPQYHGAASTGSWFAVVATFLVVALGLGVMFLIVSRSEKRERMSMVERSDSHRKAA